MLSNSQVDKLGRQLKNDEMSAEILHRLEDFRYMHSAAYRHVESVLVDTMGLQITGRPYKSTVAIVEKLRRETIRLNQIQDISGCRVLVDDLASQDDLIEKLMVLLSPLDIQVDDKRRVSTNGYRAVHIVVKKDGRPVEIQVRTRVQHAWAELSEKLADMLGHSIKYGVGDEGAIGFLAALSDMTMRLEDVRHKRMYNTSVKVIRGFSLEGKLEAKKLMAVERDITRKIHHLFRTGEVLM